MFPIGELPMETGAVMKCPLCHYTCQCPKVSVGFFFKAKEQAEAAVSEVPDEYLDKPNAGRNIKVQF